MDELDKRLDSLERQHGIIVTRLDVLSTALDNLIKRLASDASDSRSHWRWIIGLALGILLTIFGSAITMRDQVNDASRELGHIGKELVRQTTATDARFDRNDRWIESIQRRLDAITGPTGQHAPARSTMP